MKALVQQRYGGPETCEFAEVERPAPVGGQVLVRVRAAAVNAYDWHVMRGDPRLARLTLGVTRPKARVRGRDFAGRVEAVGPDVTRFRPGDEVFGDAGEADGAFAEYVCVGQELLASRPAALTPELAAAIPLAGVTALLGVRDVRAGHRLLINGAAGGVGTFAVQLAKAAGAVVTGVCGPRNVELVRSLGADHVIDYTRGDLTGGHDVVLDLVGNRSLAALRRALAPGGTLILSGGGVYRGGSLLGPMRLILTGKLLGRFGRRRVEVLTARPSAEALATLAGMAVAGAVTPVVDRTFPLAAAADAIRHVETGHARGKIVVRVADQD